MPETQSPHHLQLFASSHELINNALYRRLFYRWHDPVNDKYLPTPRIVEPGASVPFDLITDLTMVDLAPEIISHYGLIDFAPDADDLDLAIAPPGALSIPTKSSHSGYVRFEATVQMPANTSINLLLTVTETQQSSTQMYWVDPEMIVGPDGG